jgi:hypothetical protein
LGATLTTSATTGVLLTNFLALFVAFVGSEVWALSSFVIHEWRSRPELKDILHYQQQALLRAGLSHWKFLWRTWTTAQAWKSSKLLDGPIRRSRLLLLVAFFHALIFGASSIFSAAVTSTTTEVLIRSPVCGMPRIDVVFNPLSMKAEEIDDINALYTTGAWAADRSRDYARTCYLGSDALTNACGILVRSRLDSTANSSDECPFRDNACTKPTFTIDSGVVDSDFHLGINAPVKNRIVFRKKFSCAPVDAEKYSSGWLNTSSAPLFPWEPDSVPGVGYRYYDFGKGSVFGLKRNFSFMTSNFSPEDATAYTTV